MRKCINENGLEYRLEGDVYLPDLTLPQVDEELKAKDQLAWVSARNWIKCCAEEIVLHELIWEDAR